MLVVFGARRTPGRLLPPPAVVILLCSVQVVILLTIFSFVLSTCPPSFHTLLFCSIWTPTFLWDSTSRILHRFPLFFSTHLHLFFSSQHPSSSYFRETRQYIIFASECIPAQIYDLTPVWWSGHSNTPRIASENFRYIAFMLTFHCVHCCFLHV